MNRQFNIRHRPLLLKEIDKYATVHTGYKGLEVRKDGVLCEDKEGQFLRLQMLCMKDIMQLWISKRKI